MRASAAAILVLLGGCMLEFDESLLGPYDCTGIPFNAPVPVASVMSADADGSPSLSADHLTLYFSSDRPGGVGGSDLYMARRPDKTTPFEPPVNLTALNTTANDGGPSISADGLRLYFHADDLVSGQRGLRVAERASPDDAFTTATPIAIALTNAASPDIAANELALYFTSSDASGVGDVDLWILERQEVDAEWGPPTNLPNVNTPSIDGSPSVDARERTLYLHSNRVDLSSDVLVAERAGPRDAFTVTMEEPAASEDGVGEYDPDIAYDGTALALALNRGGQDIWIATRECPPIQ